jgi:uncharacterized protein YbjT (DUF2867 family)
MTTNHHQNPLSRPTLVVGGTGKTGRRIVQRLTALDHPVWIGSRSAPRPFDWDDPRTWAPALTGAGAAYIAYYPDLAAPGGADAVGAFARLAVEHDVTRLVLLSGRGEAGAERAEAAVRDSGGAVTVLRCAWFAQNFSEDYLLDQVLDGVVSVPAGAELEPFVDADDIADAAVAALTDERHAGELYELTGPRLLTFADAVETIAAATDRDVRYVPVSIEHHAADALSHGVPAEVVELLTYLFTEVLDGRNARLGDGIQRALGREPKDFADYVRDAAVAGAWDRPVSDAPASRPLAG